MSDYVSLLPSQTQLRIMEPDAGYVTHSWSKNYDSLQKNCRAQSEVCVGILAAQLDTLLAELNKGDLVAEFNKGGEHGLRIALMFSAEADLCLIAAGMTGMGPRCLGPDLPTRASIAWQQLGYDHQFLEYFDRDVANRRQYLDWLEGQSSISAEEKAFSRKQWDSGMGGWVRGALAFEMRDKLSAAYSSWLMILLQQLNLKDQQAILGVLNNLIRIAVLRGKNTEAEQWWAATQALLAENQDLREKSLCMMQGTRFSMDAIESYHILSDPEMPRRLQRLITQGCSYTEPTLLFSFRALKHGRTEMAQEVLGMAKAACERGGSCSYGRKSLIDDLLSLTRGDAAGMQGKALQWQSSMKRLESPLLWERSMIWALADKLYGGGTTAAATSLYHALDEAIEFERNQLMFNDPSDWSRYDDLKRMRVRSDLEQGIAVLPAQTESLRSQGLLKRLRGQRWMKELAGQADATDKAEYERKQNVSKNFKQAIIQALPSMVGSYRIIAQAILEDIERDGVINEEVYLDRLAKKKQGATGWLAFGGLDRYQSEQGAETIGQEYPLGEDGAYLSWLRVPGGYVATLLVPKPWEQMGKSEDTSFFIPHSSLHIAIKQRFISISAQDEAILQVYRELLQSGATVSRGARRSSDIEYDHAGLLNKGVPVWQLADGSFVTSRTTPDGAVRVKDFRGLSDALFQRLLAPFAEQYRGVRRLVISPDGDLAYLPFETLTRQGVPELETMDIGYVQSLSIYAELKRRAAGRLSGIKGKLLTVADPQYSIIASPEEEGQDLSVRLAEIRWPALPGTKAESTAIAKLFQDSRQLLGENASKESLSGMESRGALKGFQVLHFATHGYVDDEHSALVLSPEKTPLSAYLMDGDIVRWNLASSLVLLSACNTGVGRQQTGEGIVGLPYAFFMAGNINTLMSLWPVDDAGTANLIPEFVRRVQNGEDYFLALNNTKRAFARGDFGPAMSNPRIWSAFVLYGVPFKQSQ